MIHFGTVELPNPTEIIQENNEAGAGVKIGLRNLSTVQKDALAAFFKDNAQGTWVYTGSHGIEQQMRFNESALVFVQFAKNHWDVSVCLMIVDAEECEDDAPKKDIHGELSSLLLWAKGCKEAETLHRPDEKKTLICTWNQIIRHLEKRIRIIST